MPRLAIDEQRRFERAALLDEPPRVRRGPGKPLLLVAAGALLAGLLLVVLFNIDSAKPQAAATVDLGTITDIVAPRPLNPNAPGTGARGGTPISRDTQVELPAGGWIQVTDPQGQLAQQYRFERFDPRPEGAAAGYVRMERPDAEIYLSGGRVLTLSGQSALAYMPQNNMLESGDVTGNVVIRLFEPSDGRSADPARDSPSVVVRAPAARFDSVLGEVACPDDVHVFTTGGEYHGRDLSLSINDKDGTVQNLVIDKTDKIRIAASAMGPEAPVSAPVPTPAAQSATNLTHPDSQGPAASAAATASSQAPSVPAPAQSALATSKNPWNRLTLHDNVVITQGDSITGRRITGDELTLIFAIKGDSSLRTPGRARLESPCLETPLVEMPQLAMASSRREPQPSSLPPTSLAQSLALLSIAAVADRDQITPPPADDDIHITCSGKLIMTPLTDAAQIPKSPDDARTLLRGTPVTLIDYGQPAEAICAELTYSTADETTELIGSTSHPLVMGNPQFAAEGERFWWRRSDSKAGFTGPGRLSLHNKVTQTSFAPAPARSLWVDVVVLAAAMLGPEPAPRPVPQGEPSLRISWSDSVDLEFDDKAKPKAGDETGQLKKAKFNGNVEVLSTELFVSADQLAVNFAPGKEGEQQPESINATGSVFCKSMQQTGTLRCGELDVALVQNDAGEAAPRTIEAKVNVEAMDAEKTIWAQMVSVTLKISSARPQATEQAMPTSVDVGQQGGASLQNSDVELFKAEGDVQLVLSNGVRLFADSINGNSASRQMELQGNPVQLVRDQMLFERDTRVIVTEQQPGTFHVAGPGKALIFPKVIQQSGREKVSRPRVEQTPEMTVSWSDELTYDSTFNNNQGSLDLRGQVEANATPSPLEHDFIKAGGVILEFEKHADAAGAAFEGVEGAKPQAEEGGLAALQQGERSVRKLIARGDAELEARTWMNVDHSDTPRVFNVAGQLIEYDDCTGEALVVGDGRLLVRDERPDADQVSGSQGAAERDIAFGRKGTTLFKWQQKLHMTRSVDLRYDVKITGDVSVQHKGLDRETATMTCGELQVELLRQPTNNTAESASSGGACSPAFDLGGSADLRYLRAENAVYIRTPKRDIDCGRFVLDYNTQVAELAAAPGGRVSILDRSTGLTQQVDQAIWNLATDAITIERGAGTMGR